MGILSSLFGKPPYPRELKPEVDRLLDELIRIGNNEDYLSEGPFIQGFDSKSRHIRTREIGKRLEEIGGFDLMEAAYNRVRKKLGANMATHLEYAWAEIGRWMA
jgi:hypothetical protein